MVVNLSCSCSMLTLCCCKQAIVKKLILFHHAPNHSDAELEEIEKDAQSLFPNCELGREGWEWVV